MKEKISILQAKEEDAEGQKHAYNASLASLQKTNDDYAAQVHCWPDLLLFTPCVFSS